jgi:hypothetical protein
MAQPGCLANAYVICQALGLEQQILRLAGIFVAIACVLLK